MGQHGSHSGTGDFSDLRITRECEACWESGKVFQEWGREVPTPCLRKRVCEARGPGDTAGGGHASRAHSQSLWRGFLSFFWGPPWKGDKVAVLLEQVREDLLLSRGETRRPLGVGLGVSGGQGVWTGASQEAPSVPLTSSARTTGWLH